MEPHTWIHTGRRRTKGRSKVSIYTCPVCETEVEVRDSELAVEASQSREIEQDCDIVVVREVMGA